MQHLLLPSYELLYQWGRKAPFLGVSQNSTFKHSSVTRDSDTGTKEYAISHPTRFINIYGCYAGAAHWNASDLNYALWQVEKTVYDPCPFGWRIPEEKALRPNSEKEDSKTYKGMLYNGYYYANILSIWYPEAGYREVSGGNYGSGGSYGFYLGVKDTGGRACFGSTNDAWGLISEKSASTACSVRCQKE